MLIVFMGRNQKSRLAAFGSLPMVHHTNKKHFVQHRLSIYIGLQAFPGTEFSHPRAVNILVKDFGRFWVVFARSLAAKDIGEVRRDQIVTFWGMGPGSDSGSGFEFWVR